MAMAATDPRIQALKMAVSLYKEKVPLGYPVAKCNFQSVYINTN